MNKSDLKQKKAELADFINKLKNEEKGVEIIATVYEFKKIGKKEQFRLLKLRRGTNQTVHSIKFATKPKTKDGEWKTQQADVSFANFDIGLVLILNSSDISDTFSEDTRIYLNSTDYEFKPSIYLKKDEFGKKVVACYTSVNVRPK